MKIFSLIIDFYERAIIDGYEAMMQNRRLKNVRGEYVVIQYIYEIFGALAWSGRKLRIWE